jgi:hypothetical protein
MDIQNTELCQDSDSVIKISLKVYERCSLLILYAFRTHRMPSIKQCSKSKDSYNDIPEVMTKLYQSLGVSVKTHLTKHYGTDEMNGSWKVRYIYRDWKGEGSDDVNVTDWILNI